jgi:DNA polymerase-3 subunit delta'
VVVVRPEGLTYGVDETRELISSAVMSPVDGHWRVMVVEDADRLTQQASNALLKSIEEPPPHTVWVLCAPSIEDVLPTIASRTRHVHLRTPPAEDVARLIVERHVVDPALASFAARASQGHIGRARALATDERARLRRQEVLRIPFELYDLPACFMCAANLIGAATEDAAAITAPLDEAEKGQTMAGFGADSGARATGQLKRSMDAAVKRLGDAQRLRSTRTVRDQIDRAMLDLLGLYRDVLVVQTQAPVPLINEEMRPQVTQLAVSSTMEDTVRRVDAIEHTRKSLSSNAAPLMLIEALMVTLKDPKLAQHALSG